MGCWYVLLVLAGTCFLAVGENQSASLFAHRAQTNYLEMRKQFQSAPKDDEAAWQFGRACFDWAEFARDDDERERIANEGIAACRQVIARSPSSVAGHYYLGMNLGQLARTKTLAP